MIDNLFDLAHPDKLDELYFDKLDFNLEFERVDLIKAKGRIAARDIVAEVDLPPFTRSSMDGYAVKAKDTFQASETNSCYLNLVGRVEMGEATEIELNDGEAVEINTGGMLPTGADAVLMIEYTNKLSDDMLEINRAVAPGENIIQRGEDITKGEILLQAGSEIGAGEIAALAGMGIMEVEVFVKPKVSILSTGDELIPPAQQPTGGEVRDINTYSITALASQWIEVDDSGIIGDNKKDLTAGISAALRDSQVVVLSGGSSVGTKDLTIDVINQLGEPGVLVHGISVKPGKPTVLAIVDGKAVIGLPGHPTAAMVVFTTVVMPFLKRLNGYREETELTKLEATLSRNIASDRGRREFIRVKLTGKEEIKAHPITGKSGLVKTMLEADGLVMADIGREGIEAGSKVEVLLLD